MQLLELLNEPLVGLLFDLHITDLRLMSIHQIGFVLLELGLEALHVGVVHLFILLDGAQ